MYHSHVLYLLSDSHFTRVHLAVSDLLTVHYAQAFLPRLSLQMCANRLQFM